jgi:arabinogalactan endo-1,4-beta-galactosidase
MSCPTLHWLLAAALGTCSLSCSSKSPENGPAVNTSTSSSVTAAAPQGSTPTSSNTAPLPSVLGSVSGAPSASSSPVSGSASVSTSNASSSEVTLPSVSAPASSSGPATTEPTSNATSSAALPTATPSVTSSAAPSTSSAPTGLPSFILGADISSVQEFQATFVDTDGQNKDILTLLRNHGFNFIRLKTFVDPTAAYGYSSTENGCAGLAEAYGDKAHVIEFGKQIKAANLGLLLDLHYSDVWADPGNQIIPEAWRGAANIDELATFVKDYTRDVVQSAIDAGARPDMVQIGNEITPGMLMHVPGDDTDCWGNNPEPAAFGGSTANWNDLAKLLNAGAAAIRELDSTIQIMLHVENTDDLEGVQWWVDNAVTHDVDFDIMGLSCYAAFQGTPDVWQNTFETLAAEHPDLKFAIAEYNPERTRANRVMRALPNQQGVGTFFWEPTRGGEWGDSLFTEQGGTYTAKQADFEEFDNLRQELDL